MKYPLLMNTAPDVNWDGIGNVSLSACIGAYNEMVFCRTDLMEKILAYSIKAEQINDEELVRVSMELRAALENRLQEVERALDRLVVVVEVVKLTE